MSGQVCGTCYWHRRDGKDWICSNGSSDLFADWTDCDNTCEEWEDTEHA